MSAPRRAVAVALAGIVLLIGILAGGAAVRAAHGVHTRTCGGAVGQWDDYGCGYAQGVADEERAARTHPVACAGTEDAQPVDCATGAALDFRAAGPQSGWYVRH